VVEDQVGSPTNAADLAEAIMQIIGSGKWFPGMYHFSNEGVISWYDFAVEIKNLTGAGCQVQPIVTAQYPTPARRPHYSVLDKSKIKSAYGIKLKNWKDSLQRCIAQLKAGSGL
jgi:dTDP-4-dehydrorhamnose reductase